MLEGILRSVSLNSEGKDLMGLEMVELLMNVEDNFRFTIAAEEAEQIRTVGDLHRLVCRQVVFVEESACHTSQLFYRVRRELLELRACWDQGRLVGDPWLAVAAGTHSVRSSLRPSTELESLFPAPYRGQLWSYLQGRLGVVLPPLSLSGEDLGALDAATMVASLGVLALLVIVPGGVNAKLTGVAGAIVAMALVRYVVRKKLAHRVCKLPAECQTLGTLTRAIDSSTRTGRPHNEEDVWPVLRSIIAEKLSVDVKRVTRDAHFIRDLGAD